MRAVVVHDLDGVRGDRGHRTGLLGGDDVTGVDRSAVLHAGADQRRLRLDQRHRLALHVRAHERAVRVVVLEERDQRGRHRHHLARRDVHVVHLGGRDDVDLAHPLADQHPLLGEGAVLVQRGVGLRDDEAVLLVGGEVVDLVGDPAVLDLAVRRLDEPERVDPAEGRQRADQTDVRALRRLDRAHPAVVGRVHVADLEARTVTRQTTGAERGEPALVRQPRDRVGLVHELRQLRGAEELLQRRHHGADVDQRLRRDRLDVLGRHPLADHPLHPGEAGAELVLDELADGAQATVAEVVDVVGPDLDLLAVLAGGDVALRVGEVGLVGVQLHDEADRRHDVVDGQRLLVERQVEAELLVDLVAADLGEVVALAVEVVVVQQRLRGLAGRRLARAELAVDVEQRVVLAGRVVLLQGQHHRLVLAELLADLLLGPAERLEQDGDVLLALAVEAYADHVALVDLELEPRTPRRDELRGVDVLVGRLVRGALEVDARGPDELRDDDALGAVDDEGALVGHEREVAHEDRLALDLTGLVVRELRRDVERRGVGEVLLLALLDGVLRVVEHRVLEGERHGAREVLDRGDLLEDLLEPGLGAHVLAGVGPALDLRVPRLVADQPVEAVGLESEELGNFEGLGDLREGDPAGAFICGAGAIL